MRLRTGGIRTPSLSHCAKRTSADERYECAPRRRGCRIRRSRSLSRNRRHPRSRSNGLQALLEANQSRGNGPADRRRDGMRQPLAFRALWRACFDRSTSAPGSAGGVAGNRPARDVRGDFVWRQRAVRACGGAACSAPVADVQRRWPSTQSIRTAARGPRAASREWCRSRRGARSTRDSALARSPTSKVICTVLRLLLDERPSPDGRWRFLFSVLCLRGTGSSGPAASGFSFLAVDVSRSLWSSGGAAGMPGWVGVPARSGAKPLGQRVVAGLLIERGRCLALPVRGLTRPRKAGKPRAVVAGVRRILVPCPCMSIAARTARPSRSSSV